MKKGFSFVLPALLLSSLGSLPACASLIGSSVTGSLTFAGDPSNYFDPGYGFVPASGYLNASGTTVTVSGSAVEFGYDDGTTLVSADLAADQIAISEQIEQSGSNNPFQIVFTDAAFAGLPFTVTGGNLVPTDFSIAGDTVTLDYAANDVTAGEMLTTTVGPSPVPEPSTLVLTLTSVVASFALFAFGGLRPQA